jgi:hypothetical protein
MKSFIFLLIAAIFLIFIYEKSQMFFWILLILIIVAFYFLIIKPAFKGIDEDIQKHKDFIGQNKIDFKKLIPSGKYIGGLPDLKCIKEKTSVCILENRLVIFDTQIPNSPIGIGKIEKAFISGVDLIDFDSFNKLIIKRKLILPEYFPPSLAQLNRHLPYYMAIKYNEKSKLISVMFSFEGKNAVLDVMKSSNDILDLINEDKNNIKHPI